MKDLYAEHTLKTTRRDLIIKWMNQNDWSSMIFDENDESLNNTIDRNIFQETSLLIVRIEN